MSNPPPPGMPNARTATVRGREGNPFTAEHPPELAAPGPVHSWPHILLFSLTSFLGAALLFLVEPMAAKMVLPLLGGSAAVWTTCLVFFQAALLAGYVYAHLSGKLLGRTGQILFHALVFLAAVVMLPLGIPQAWTPPARSEPILWLLWLLLATIGLPFFALSATAPILQKWFAQARMPRSHDPYFLYAASNAGSLFGLLCYPFVFEPLLRLSTQARLWSWSYGLFLLLAAGCMLRTRQAHNVNLEDSPALPRTETPPVAVAPPPTWSERGHWLALAFVPSSLMLGVTSALTTDVPAVPLLWILPLTLYLLSFVLVFAPRLMSPHRWLCRQMPLLILAAAIPIALKGTLPFFALLGLDLATLFVVAMVCHGELAQSRPSIHHLTEFYLWVSVGGVLGGMFNALLAPVLFDSLAELPIALVLAAVLCPVPESDEDTSRSRWLDALLPAALGLAVAIAIAALQKEGLTPGRTFNLVIFGPAAILCLRFRQRPRRFGLGVAALILASQVYTGPFGHVLLRARSFFGVYRVSDDPEKNCRVLFHGSIPHGLQSLDPRHREEPLAYYTRSGPVGQVFAAFRGSAVENNVAVIGLGAGVIAAYHQPNQRITFYEIDPTVLAIARDRRYFTFLSDCGADAQVLLGDARLRMRNAPAQSYGMIVLDAFSGDSIPVHLLTREALALYLDKLVPHGILVFDITNRYLDLHGPVAAVARDAGLVALVNDDVASDADAREGKFSSWWVVMARSPEDLATLQDNPSWNKLEPPPGVPVWTDDYSNIVSILRFN